MKKSDEELISAYLDNELDSEERAQVEKRLTNDQDFAMLFSRFEEQDAIIGQSFSSIDNLPLTPGLQATVNSLKGSEENVVPLKRNFIRTWFPIAATVALAVILAPALLFDSSEDVITKSDVLDTGLSGQTFEIENDQKVFLSMSFKDSGQRWCREYFIGSSASASQEIACKSNNQWRTEVSVDVAFPDPGQFMPASGGSQSIENWIDGNIDGDILTTEQEQIEINNPESD